MSSVLSELPKELPLDFLRSITDQFSEDRKLGADEFGSTYKGIMPDGLNIVVKRLKENSPVARGKVFDTELAIIMGLRHKNIVKVVAYCHEVQKKVVQRNGRYVVAEIVESLICYEYATVGSLHVNLFGKTTNRADVQWSTRFKIIKDICEGLNFMHNIPIIHMDLKPENIWLDDGKVAKIANFGLSRIFGEEQTREYTQNLVGSYGYIAPEYLYRGEISTKSDIYSLGLIIIEITTGERNHSSNEPSAREYIEKIREEWTDGHIASMYKTLTADILQQQVCVCIQTGLQCVEIDRQKRPPIEEIVHRLNASSVDTI